MAFFETFVSDILPDVFIINFWTMRVLKLWICSRLLERYRVFNKNILLSSQNEKSQVMIICENTNYKI